MDGLTLARAVLPPRTDADDARVDVAARRQGDGAQQGAAAANKAHVHGEFVPPGGELPRPVERIDQPEHIVRGGHSPARDFLLGDNRDLRRCRAQPSDDDRLSGVVGGRNRRRIGLVCDREPPFADPSDRRSGAACQLCCERKQSLFISFVHAILIAGGPGNGKPHGRCYTPTITCSRRGAIRAMLEIAFAKPQLPRSGALALLIGEGDTPAGLWQAAEEATGGALGRALKAAEFTGKNGQDATILAPGAGLARVVAVGLGKATERTRLLVEEAGGTAGSMLRREPSAVIAADALPPELAAAAAHGAVLRSYRFDGYRTQEKSEEKPRLQKLSVHSAEPAKARAAYAPMQALAEGVFLTRDLVSEPPNVLNPAEMAERCKSLAQFGLDVEVLGPKDLRKLGFGALLGVAQGSANEPRMVVLRWRGAPAGRTTAKPVAFIGKGVTFDTGGISIKPAAGMEDMKWDMAGAGTVVGLMRTLAARKARVDAIGLVGLVENMPSGTAQRPGDVVKTASGQTVEVLNTDAEGRLVLADVLWYCQNRFAPRFMIDLATLTGAIIVSLGHEHAGLFSNDNALAEALLKAGRETGELVWRMPLAEAYDKQLRSDIADMKNITGRPGSSITAAQFLQRFVDGKPWAHLDIAGTAWSTKDAALVPKGATSFGVRLLDRLVADSYED
jgi:leucyl aminopeptidase